MTLFRRPILGQSTRSPRSRPGTHAGARTRKQSCWPECPVGSARQGGLGHTTRAPSCKTPTRLDNRRSLTAWLFIPSGSSDNAGLGRISASAHDTGHGKVTGVRWEQADRAAMAEEPADMAALRDGAIVPVASDALLRVSAVAALDVSDIDLAEQTVLIRHSKIAQERKGTVQFLGKPITERAGARLRRREVQVKLSTLQRNRHVQQPHGPRRGQFFAANSCGRPEHVAGTLAQARPT